MIKYKDYTIYKLDDHYVCKHSGKIIGIGLTPDVFLQLIYTREKLKNKLTINYDTMEIEEL